MGKKVIVMGAAGRDFHNFNTLYRGNPEYEVIAFTATQIPNIDGRRYPAELSGELYPYGIPIHPEEELENLMLRYAVDEVLFSYSDVPYEYVMRKASIVNRLGASFRLPGMGETQIKSTKPVVAVCAVRTGCGKSQTTRKIASLLQAKGKRVAVIRHPMPYGDLVKQKVQSFQTVKDLDLHQCTIEEREEYEPHLMSGIHVFAGVDYEAILREAEKVSDIILWDGGNNDFSFYQADLYITIVDPHRPGDEKTYYPGETNVRAADILIINKIETADAKNIQAVMENIRELNTNAVVLEAASPIQVESPDVIKNKRVLVIEDGPTLTHGGMKYGAGTVAAKKYGALEIIDPKPFAVGTIKETYEKYPKIENVLPAMGYGEQQVRDLEKTIRATNCESVIIGTPIDLRGLIKIEQQSTRVTYDLQEIGTPDLNMLLEDFLNQKST